MCSRPFETRSLPNSLAASLAVLPSMSLFPKAPFDLSVLPIYVARVPAAPFTRSYPRHFYVDHSHCLVLAPATLAALPSTRAIPIATCSMPARRSLGEGGSIIPFAPFGDVMANEQSRKGISEIEGKVARV